MSERKTRVTVRIDPHLAEYAKLLVRAGKARSISAVINDALEQKSLRDRRGLSLLKAQAAQADPEKVARMKAGVDAQLAELG
jgi:Arc/MetJ-type ribon-helix-helix transcriptional regulator